MPALCRLEHARAMRSLDSVGREAVPYAASRLLHRHGPESRGPSGVTPLRAKFGALIATLNERRCDSLGFRAGGVSRRNNARMKSDCPKMLCVTQCYSRRSVDQGEEKIRNIHPRKGLLMMGEGELSGHGSTRSIMGTGFNE